MVPERAYVKSLLHTQTPCCQPVCLYLFKCTIKLSVPIFLMSQSNINGEGLFNLHVRDLTVTNKLWDKVYQSIYF